MKTFFLFLALTVSVFGQNYSGSHTFSTTLCTNTFLITGGPVVGLTSGSISSFGLPVSASATSNQNAPAQTCAPSGCTYTISGVSGNQSGGASGSIVLTINGANQTYLISNDSTITITTVTFTGSLGSYNVTPTTPYQFMWHHAAKTTTAITAPVLSLVTLPFSATNGSGTLGEYAIFEENVLTGQIDGDIYNPVWLSPGGTADWSFSIPANDNYGYFVGQVDLTKLAGASVGAEVGTSGVTEGTGYTPLGYGATVTASSGTVNTTMPTNGTTAVTGGLDGGDLAITITSLGGNQPIMPAQPGSITPVTLTASGGGTSGGGGGGASDAGLVNNAAAINTGIAAAANSINTTISSGVQAITKTELAGASGVMGAIQQAELGTGGTSYDGPSAGDFDSKLGTLTQSVNAIPGTADTYSATSSQQVMANAYLSSAGATVASNVTSDQADALAAGNTLIGQAGSFADGASIASSGNPLPAGSGYATSAHTIASTNPLINGGSDFDQNPFTSALFGGILGSSALLAFVGWIRDFILWGTVLWWLRELGEKVFEITGIVMGTVPNPPSALAMFMAHATAGGFSVGTLAAIGIQAAFVVVLSTLVLAAPGLVVAGLDTWSAWPSLSAAWSAASRGISASGGGVLANVFDYIWMILPVPTLVAIAVYRSFLAHMATFQLMVVGAVVKLLHL